MYNSILTYSILFEKIQFSNSARSLSFSGHLISGRISRHFPSSAAGIFFPLLTGIVDHVISHKKKVKGMPIYEYRCTKCGKTFDALQHMSAEPLKKCIFCHGKVEKLISASSFQLKGSGWYITDYKKRTLNKNLKISPRKKKKAIKMLPFISLSISPPL